MSGVLRTRLTEAKRPAASPSSTTSTPWLSPFSSSTAVRALLLVSLLFASRASAREHSTPKHRAHVEMLREVARGSVAGGEKHATTGGGKHATTGGGKHATTGGGKLATTGGGIPEREPKTADLGPLPHRRQRNRYFCGECPFASASLPDRGSNDKFVHLHYTTTLGYGRTGNYVMAMQNAFKLAFLCKAVLELPAFDFQGNAFTPSSQRFFDLRNLKPGDVVQAPECTNTANDTLYFWFLQFGTRTRHLSAGSPFLRYLPEVDDERVVRITNVCLQRYLGICGGEGEGVGVGGGGGVGGGVVVVGGGGDGIGVDGGKAFRTGEQQQFDDRPPFCRGLFKRDDDEQRTVVAHVRHGDVYPANFTELPVPLEYGQPPLSTYLSVFDFVNASRVILVGEPSFKGPVWKALEMLQANNALRYEVEFRSGDFREDLRLMLCANTVVESRSTLMSVVRLGFASSIFTTEECFRPAVAPPSSHVQKVYHCDASDDYKKYYRRHTNEASEWVDALLGGSRTPRLCEDVIL